jgi:hypothetical protein
VAGEKRFVPYLLGSVINDDGAADEHDNDHDNDNENENENDGDGDGDGDDAVTDDDAATLVNRKQGPFTSWTKALILTAATILISAFAWYAAERFVGRSQWIIKFSAIAWLIGMGTASAMIGARRSGAAGKIVAVLAAIVAIVLGKALILGYPELPPELMHAADPTQWGRDFARLAFKPIDGLFAGLVIMGSAARFILSQRD